MFLSITTTYQPATDFGYLLHKHPDRVQAFKVSGGTAHVFYPVATESACQVALLLDVNPIELVRGMRRQPTADQYVNDRPYTANSFLSTAISGVFSSALNGRCPERPELVTTPLPLVAEFSALRVLGGYEVLRRVFEPLGYTLEAEALALDPAFPDWGASAYFAVRLTHTVPLQDLLTHLYILLPVFDYEKHYWTTQTDVETLLAKGERWLRNHPEREWITRRYLRHGGKLVRSALEQLEPETAASRAEMAEEPESETLARTNALHEQRLEAVARELKNSGAASVIDLGCGDGRLLQILQKDAQFRQLAGADVSYSALQKARRRLFPHDDATPRQQERIKLFQTALTYRDDRLHGYDAAALVEVIEHLDEERLPALEKSVFGIARPHTIVVTTPNAEYNVRFDEFRPAAANITGQALRHADHRFEWTRDEFEHWCENVAAEYGYTVRYFDVGEVDAEVGAITQMAVFAKI
jgi:3' terminal RNA ribose 2'-O-methyltransferase Hen1